MMAVVQVRLRLSSWFTLTMKGLIVVFIVLGHWVVCAQVQTQAQPPTSAPKRVSDPPVQQSADGIWEKAIEAAVGDQPALEGRAFGLSLPEKRPRWPACANPKVQVNASPRPVGRLSLSLRCDAPRWIGALQVLVSARRSHWVTTKALSQGTIIAESDVVLTESDWASLSEDVVTELDQVLGRTLNRSVSAGQALGLNFVRQTAVIKTGEKIRVQMTGSNFTVSGDGVAMQQGVVGESMRAKMASGQIVTGTVVRAGLIDVRVD
jgi:flagella basal body P-ring formation protein FlgA